MERLPVYFKEMTEAQLAVVDSIERRLAQLYRNCFPSNHRDNIYTELLRERKRILDKAFLSTDENHKLLEEFVEKSKAAMFDMRERLRITHELIGSHTEIGEDIAIDAYVYPRFDFSISHPEADEEYLDNLHDMFDDQSFGGLEYNLDMPPRYEYHECMDDDEFLYSSLSSWDERMDREWCKDIKLPRYFHHMYDHTLWSLFDILHIKEYDINIKIDIDHWATPRDTRL
ncbi:hypothetical protein HPS57_10230 [Prevotella sp. PINT]|jgi:hypothetical protein|uniref:hypothetical protein n=1 Tax=Palleniella intestinalis TaxID=2736291 RepID=UPI001557779A|nr:hypothetical protein [Palleniella intestinalis]NPD82344.1 hypothetical protein [Palleniella intestinalis]